MKEIKEFHNLSIRELHLGLERKEFSALELAKSFLSRIEKFDRDISSFLNVAEDLALSQAGFVDEMIAQRKKISLLAGIPFAVKDIILVEGQKTTCASRMLENYVSPYDATCVSRLKKEGAVILGKTNLDEFAMGSSTENSAFFPTKNPADLERVPGGSSGGSAAAVAKGLCSFALGSDTGGSIRLPASFCGVAGLKPTYGAVSRYGLVAFASSLDQIGPIAKTAEDAEIVFSAIAGKDDMDSTSMEIKPFNKSITQSLNGLTIGLPGEYFIEGIASEVKIVMEKAVKKFEEMGAKTEQVSLPHTKYAIPVYYIVMSSEASANLARYDGIKYGVSPRKSRDLERVYLESREDGFGKEVKRRIMLGTYALSSGYYDDYYLKAQKVRTLIKKDFRDAFKKVDVVLTPVSPVPAFRLGEKIKDPLAMYLADIFTVSANLAGLPALALPAGNAGNLPVGLQLIGKHFEENTILAMGRAFEAK